jgi:ABC-type lipoprotein release transport system permease subunit
VAERVDAMLTQDRLMTSLSLYAGGLSLLLASIGLYGVTAYASMARRREIGIRLALGSEPRRVVRLIVWKTMRPLVAGLFLGAAMSVWTGQIVESLLFEVAPRDPLVLSGAVLALVCVGLLASSARLPRIAGGSIGRVEAAVAITPLCSLTRGLAGELSGMM